MTTDTTSAPDSATPSTTDASFGTTEQRSVPERPSTRSIQKPASRSTEQTFASDERVVATTAGVTFTGRDILSALIDFAVLACVTALAWRSVVPGGFAGFTIGVVVGTRAAMSRARTAFAGSAAGAVALGLWHLLTVRALARG